MDNANSNKRIAKNSLYLYLQMAIRLVITLFTTRVVLNVLGVEDYGIHNVVAGFVTMFTFISDTMVSASQRFFACELGVGNLKKLNDYFNATFFCYIIIIGVLVVLVEVVGVWFLNNKMVIPETRIVAANWVFHLAVITFVINLLSVPYTSMIIAQERMGIFAFVSLVAALLRLLIVYLLLVMSGDKLIIYSFLIVVVTFINAFWFYIYCKKRFRRETMLRIVWNGSMMKELFSFSGWSLFWTLANVGRSQGINVLLNIFFNPVVNAARGIAYQVNAAINQFVNSFYQAVRPSIMKLSAKQELDRMCQMVFTSSKLSFYMMLLVAVPIIFEAPSILSIWLDVVPENTVMFTRLVVVIALIDTLGLPLITAVNANGNIKWFNVIIGSILLLNLPISYLFLWYGYPAEIVFWVAIVISVIAHLVRVVYSKKIFGMRFLPYCKEVICRIFFVIGPVAFFSYLIHISHLNFLFKVTLMLLLITLVAVLVGISSRERKALYAIVKNHTNK